jgi:hypothetical protein
VGYTTFTGPIRAGNILHTTGTDPGANVSNVGQVVMAQTAAVVEGANTITTISIPGASQILDVTMRTTVAFTNAVSLGGTQDGTTITATYFTDAIAAPAAVGLTTFSTTTAGQNNNWIAVGYDTPSNTYSDVQVVVSGGAVAGPGRGVLTVTYMQGPNGNT